MNQIPENVQSTITYATMNRPSDVCEHYTTCKFFVFTRILVVVVVVKEYHDGQVNQVNRCLNWLFRHPINEMLAWDSPVSIHACMGFSHWDGI
jgi:hypothetical protein